MEKIKVFVKNILNKSEFKLDDILVRRDIKNVKNLEDIDNIEFKNRQDQYLKINILLLGFSYSMSDNCRTFEMERMLFPYYLSFYINNPVYLNIFDNFFEADYNKKQIIKIDKIPEIDLIISRANYISVHKNLIDSFEKKPIKIVIAPINDYKQDADFIFDNSFLFKLPEPSEIKLYMENINRRQNIILFCGALYSDKGQLEFMQNVDENIIKDYLILFLGGIKKQKYYDSIVKIAKEKNINILKYFCHPRDLHKIVPKCKYQITYCANSRLDPNPRAITEGLFAGLPFLVSDFVTIPKLLWRNPKIGVVCANNNAKDLNKKLRILLTLKNEDVINFVKEKCQVDDVCKNTTEKVIETYNKLNS